jgi:hypothetical protein
VDRFTESSAENLKALKRAISGCARAVPWLYFRRASFCGGMAKAQIADPAWNAIAARHAKNRQRIPVYFCGRTRRFQLLGLILRGFGPWF